LIGAAAVLAPVDGPGVGIEAAGAKASKLASNVLLVLALFVAPDGGVADGIEVKSRRSATGAVGGGAGRGAALRTGALATIGALAVTLGIGTAVATLAGQPEPTSILPSSSP